MRVFTCIDHDCVYPVGVASVVVAEDEQQAVELLNAALVERGLSPSTPDNPDTFVEVDLTKPMAIVLRDGDY